MIYLIAEKLGLIWWEQGLLDENVPLIKNKDKY